MERFRRSLLRMPAVSRSSAVILCAILVVLGAECSVVQAQDSLSPGKGSYFWVTGGVGNGSAGLAGTFMFSSLTPAGLYAVRYGVTGELFAVFPNPSESVEEWGVLRGLYVGKNRTVFAAVSGGIAYVSGVQRGRWLIDYDYERLTFHTVGIIFHGQFAVTPLPFLGFGIDFPVNLNPQRSFAAVQLSAHLGILWRLHALDM